MKVSRKEFLRRGVFSLGKGLFGIAGVLDRPAPGAAAAEVGKWCGAPGEGGVLVAVADNRRCLAGGCGCFLCLERCRQGAIELVVGEGIRIEEARCSGCGTCGEVCPVSPRAVSLTPREASPQSIDAS